MQVSKKIKKPKGLSLVEILIVLIIISTTVISAMSLIINSFIEIKENEVQDTANGILLSATEALKSPGVIQISGLSSGILSRTTGDFFSVTPNDSGFVLTYVPGGESINECDSDSRYLFNLRENQQTIDQACLQVKIIDRSGLGITKYEIEAKVVYNFSGKTETNSIKAFRYEELEFLQL